MKSAKILMFLGAIVVPIAGAQAVAFSNFLINGVAPGPGNPSNFGPNGVSFSIPDHFLVGVGVKTLTIDYRVDAAPGMVLNTFSMHPVGVAKNGSVAIDVSHTNGGTQVTNYLVTAGPTLTALPSQTNIGLAPQQTFYNVHTVITLTGTANDSINKATVYSVTYSEAVPEPATMAVLALGIGALATRRTKRNR